jgi:hypothetical protein
VNYKSGEIEAASAMQDLKAAHGRLKATSGVFRAVSPVK